MPGPPRKLVVPQGRQGPGPLPSEALARIDLALLRRAGGVLPGDHLSAGAGAGTELARLRPYEPGDDVRQLDPSASARTGIPHVRLQVPERAVTTWLVLDVSPSMAFGTRTRLKSDIVEGVAGALGRLAVRRGGRVAVVTAGEDSPRMLRPRGGRGALAGLSRLVNEGVMPDGATGGPLADALTRVARLATSRGIVVVVSDFRGEDDWGPLLRRLAARHTVVAVEVTDPREAELPDTGHLHLVDPETGELVEIDTSAPRLRARFAAVEQQRRERVAAALRRAPATHVVLSTGGDWLRELGKALR
ncbi:DUF58 domain-containing protein [Paraconexibacter sp.]|uniref:DUF58 domain-containing protein n=1 Tax=Paraconexibacter sp. TaxID=2949640 RepID=UPI00356A1883